MDCIVCGRKVNVHWLGEGDYCSEHFKEVKIKHHGVSEKEKRIEENWQDRAAKPGRS